MYRLLCWMGMIGWLGLSQSAMGQPDRFFSYAVSEGLSQNSVQCIFQDSDGALWLGTQDGLNRFDGRNFRVFKHDRNDSNSISDQFILSIREDKPGFLWVGTRNGLNRINRRTGKVNRIYLDSTETNRISGVYNCLQTNHLGEIYIRHMKKASLVDQQGRLIQLDPKLNEFAWACFDQTGHLWGLRPASKSFCRVDGLPDRPVITILPHTPSEILDPSNQYRFKSDQQDVLWCYSSSREAAIWFYHIKTSQWVKLNQDIPGVVSDVLITNEGVGWVCTSNGIYLIKAGKLSGKISPSNAPNSIPAGSILTAFQDRQKNIWVGSSNSGFAYTNPAFDQFRLIQTGFRGEAITAIAAGNGGDRWVGTANGLLRLTKEGQEFRVSQQFFAGKKISGLTLDQQQRIWVAVEKEGLYILDRNGGLLKKHIQQDTVLQSKGVLYLFCDSRNRVFVCTEMGFFVFSNPSQWKPFYARNKKPAGPGWYTLHAYEDRQKRIWISKHMGVEVLDSNLNQLMVIESGTNQSPIRRTIITACTQDIAGNNWISTLSNGVYLYRNGVLRQYTTADGLNSNVTYGILTDDKGRVWVTTTSGINVFEPATNKFYQLTVKDGLPTNDFLLGAFSKGENGVLLAGSSNGLVQIDATGISLQTRVAEARISDCKVDGQSIDFLTGAYTLLPGYQTISFEFAVKASLQPRNIYYQYRMLGLNEQWTTVNGDNSQITFSKLPNKQLVMELRAADAIPDLETAPISRFTLTIIPPFTQTTVFRMMVLLLVLLVLVASFAYYNRRKNRKQQEALRLQLELKQERERISRDLHDNIGAYTSALIAGINQLKDTGQAREENISELNEYASNIMGYLRETIWVLSNEELTLTAFSDRFKNYASRIVRNYSGLSIRFEAGLAKERRLTPQISLNLFRILQEALQNACKHAAATEIIVSFASDQRMRFRLSDNGAGISGEKREDSYGIRNMQQRAEEIGFLMSVRSVTGRGTDISLEEK